ncbi:serine/threonine-protein phosphatase 6 regulatory ankyrin repeat subunit B-like [Leptopilina boulardi]|uniref:serine/threonine-protein phosphatase 6 regulatory ankyrin repeat subunit B-like n=1 Tax=Leptopilina boulardi TaxID=63433 RepID=UPI0021F58852|nr:serine/threonine-protein phosphatase 6 regulatory ankyrin repeat subunit B-like [Leptopilina boulardi]
MEKKIYNSELVDAAQKGNVDEMKIHFKKTSTLPTKDDQFYFALYFASFNGKEDIVKYLLAKKVDPNYTVGSYLTPLHAAILNKHDSIVELLLQHGANVDPKIKVKSGKKIVEKNYFCSPLICAAYKSNEKVTELLLKRGAIVNVKLQSIDVDKNKKTTYYQQSTSEDKNENYLIYGTFSSYDLRNDDSSEHSIIGFTPLHFVIRSGGESIAQLLLDYGADINARCKIDLTPLCLACDKKTLKMVKFLLKAGADMKAQVNNGKHLLCYILHCIVIDSFQECYEEYEKSAWVERSKIFSYFLKIGADPNGWSSKDKESVLHRAASDGLAHAVHLLLKHGANVNAVNGDLKTPLECTVSHLQELLTDIQDSYSCLSDSSSDDDYHRHDMYTDSDEENFYQQEAENRRKEREEYRKRQYENRKIYNLTHNTYTFNLWQYKKNHNNDEGYTIFKDPNPFRMVSQLLTRELVRLEALGIRNCEQNVKFLQTTFVKPYYTRCKNELKKLKKNKIADDVNYYDFLLANDTKLIDYMKNKNIASAIDKGNCRKLFPNYCRYLRLNVKRGLKRKRTNLDDESDGSSDEDVAKGSVQMRGNPKRRRHHFIDGEMCVLS